MCDQENSVSFPDYRPNVATQALGYMNMDVI